jgi:flagellin
MSRINTNVQSLIAQRVLQQNQGQLNTSLERLSTGLKINRGKDDPAGLIASENLNGESRSINTAISNAQRADQVVNIAEGGLQEVSGLLTELQSLVTASASTAGLSSEEKQANQLQIDSIIQTIDRISSSTSFQGLKLLNGNFDFKTSGIATGVEDFRVNAAKWNGTKLDVNVLVTTSAQQAGVYLSNASNNLDLGTGSSFVLEVTGRLGSRQFSFSSGTTLASIATTINQYSDVTGIKATASTNNTGLKVFSDGWGKDEFVSVKVVKDGAIGTTSNIGFYSLQSGNFNAAATSLTQAFTNTNALNDSGQDLGATINGIAATANGKTIRINTDFLDTEITLTDSQSRALGNVGTGSNPAFSITGGGATFQLAGKVDIGGRVAIGIQDVSARKLGNAVSGYLSDLTSGNTGNVVNGDTTKAQRVVTEAIEQVSATRGRLGAFQKNVVGATIRSLGVAVENSAAAQSVIRDSDFAAETAALTRSQILASSSTNILGLANQSPQQVLQLLG